MRALAGKTALVTGSTDGLGYSIAKGLAEAGCHIVLNGLASVAHGEQLCRQLEQDHAIDALYCPANLAELNEISGLLQAADRRFGAVDILVNNAVVRHFAPIEAFSVEWWEEALAVNISAAFHLIRLAIPAMRARGYGRIVNLTSVYGLRAVANRVDYVTTKAALMGLTRAVALESLEHGVTCNAVCPGAVLTAYSGQKIAGLMRDATLSREDATRKFLTGKQPTGRFIAAEAVVDLVVFLCGPTAQDITGAVLPVDAGWMAS
jgi:3-hydroxybutyrate dehydrogenase